MQVGAMLKPPCYFSRDDCPEIARRHDDIRPECKQMGQGEDGEMRDLAVNGVEVATAEEGGYASLVGPAELSPAANWQRNRLIGRIDGDIGSTLNEQTGMTK